MTTEEPVICYILARYRQTHICKMHYLGEKMRYSYESLLPYAPLNMLYRLVSRDMHIYFIVKVIENSFYFLSFLVFGGHETRGTLLYCMVQYGQRLKTRTARKDKKFNSKSLDLFSGTSLSCRHPSMALLAFLSK